MYLRVHLKAAVTIKFLTYTASITTQRMFHPVVQLEASIYM